MPNTMIYLWIYMYEDEQGDLLILPTEVFLLHRRGLCDNLPTTAKLTHRELLWFVCDGLQTSTPVSCDVASQSERSTCGSS